MTRKEVTKIISKIVIEWQMNGFTYAKDINNGNCDTFAEEVRIRCGEGKAIWSDECGKLFKTKSLSNGYSIGETAAHCFFALRGFYYDSECPEGVRNPEDLPYYQREIILDREYWKREKKTA